MSHSYIDGVPVKISERYKPPPKISLPQKIVQCLAECHNAADDRPSPADEYDFQAEHNHQRQAAAWKNARREERYARRQRQHQRQVDRQREHDERQKQKLTAVSYPSADELSSGDDDEDTTNNDADDARTEDNHSTTAATSSLATTSSGLTTAETTPQSHQEEPPSSNQSHQQPRFDTILMPTIMPLVGGHPARNPSDSNWSFAAKLAADREAAPSSTGTAAGGSTVSWSKINWSDFENDTSSPFDNIELKSINDLDILAQVLNLNADADATVDADATTTTTTAKQPAAAAPTTCDNVHSMASSVDRAEAATVISNTTGTPTTTTTTATPTPPQRITTTTTTDNMINSNNIHMPTATGSPQSYNAVASFYGQYGQPYGPQYNHMAYGQQNSPTIGDMPPNTATSSAYTMPSQAVYHFNYHNTVNAQAQTIGYADARYASSYGGTHATGATATMSAMRGFDGVVGAFKSSSVPDILRHTTTTGGVVTMGSSPTDAMMAKRMADNGQPYVVGNVGATGAMGPASANGGAAGSVRFF